MILLRKNASDKLCLWNGSKACQLSFLINDKADAFGALTIWQLKLKEQESAIDVDVPLPRDSWQHPNKSKEKEKRKGFDLARRNRRKCRCFLIGSSFCHVSCLRVLSRKDIRTRKTSVVRYDHSSILLTKIVCIYQQCILKSFLP